MKKRIAIISVLSSLVIFTGLAACRHGHNAGGFDQFDLQAATNRIASRLDLSEFQKSELERILSEIAAKAKQLRADHQARHQELADLVRQEAIDPEVVDNRITERFDSMRELVDYAAERLIVFHATLTPEQREKAAEEIENHAARHHAMFR
jgi:uncharacterized membrane protein